MTIATPPFASNYYCGPEIPQHNLTAKLTLLIEKMKHWGTCPPALLHLSVSLGGNCFGLGIAGGISFSREYQALRAQGLDATTIAERLNDNSVFLQRLKTITGSTLEACLLISILSPEVFQIICAHDMEGYNALKVKYNADPLYLRMLNMAWNKPVAEIRQLFTKRIESVLPLLIDVIEGQAYQSQDDHVANQNGLSRIAHYGGVFKAASFQTYFQNLKFDANTHLLVIACKHVQLLSVIEDGMYLAYDPNRNCRRVSAKSEVSPYIWQGLRLLGSGVTEPISIMAFMPTSAMSQLYLKENDSTQALALLEQIGRGELATTNLLGENILFNFIFYNDVVNVMRVLPHLPLDHVFLYGSLTTGGKKEYSLLVALIQKNDPYLLATVLKEKACDINRPYDNQKLIQYAVETDYIHSFRALISHPNMVLTIEELQSLIIKISARENLEMMVDFFKYLLTHEDQLLQLVMKYDIIPSISFGEKGSLPLRNRILVMCLECYQKISALSGPTDILMAEAMHKKIQKWLQSDLGLDLAQQDKFKAAGFNLATQRVNPFDLIDKREGNPFDSGDEEHEEKVNLENSINPFDFIAFELEQKVAHSGNPFESDDEPQPAVAVERPDYALPQLLKSYLLDQHDASEALLQECAKYPHLLGLQQTDGLTPLHMCLFGWSKGRALLSLILKSDLGFSSVNAIYQSPSIDPNLQGTPLQIGYALRGRTWIVQEVFSQEDKLLYLDINMLHPITKESFIQQVARAGDVKMIDHLVRLQERNLISFDPNLVDGQGKTLFHTLIETGFREQALKLLKSQRIVDEINLRIQDVAGNHLLHTAYYSVSDAASNPFGDDLDHYLEQTSKDKHLGLELVRNAAGKLPIDIFQQSNTPVFFVRRPSQDLVPEQKEAAPMVQASQTDIVSEASLARILKGI